MNRYDAVVVGSGPNGLAAAVTLARQRKSVLVLEAEQTPGGGLRSRELTRPGYVHDVCAAIVPLCVASPFFCQTPLASFGLEMIWPPVSVAHPFDDGSAASLERSVERTALGLGPDQAGHRPETEYPVESHGCNQSEREAFHEQVLHDADRTQGRHD